MLRRGLVEMGRGDSRSESTRRVLEVVRRVLETSQSGWDLVAALGPRRMRLGLAPQTARSA